MNSEALMYALAVLVHQCDIIVHYIAHYYGVVRTSTLYLYIVRVLHCTCVKRGVLSYIPGIPPHTTNTPPVQLLYNVMCTADVLYIYMYCSVVPWGTVAPFSSFFHFFLLQEKEENQETTLLLDCTYYTSTYFFLFLFFKPLFSIFGTAQPFVFCWNVSVRSNWNVCVVCGTRFNKSEMENLNFQNPATALRTRINRNERAQSDHIQNQCPIAGPTALLLPQPPSRHYTQQLHSNRITLRNRRANNSYYSSACQYAQPRHHQHTKQKSCSEPLPASSLPRRQLRGRACSSARSASIFLAQVWWYDMYVKTVWFGFAWKVESMQSEQARSISTASRLLHRSLLCALSACMLIACMYVSHLRASM